MSPLAARACCKAWPAPATGSSRWASADTSSSRATAARRGSRRRCRSARTSPRVLRRASKGWAVGHDGVILHTERRRRDLGAAARRPARQRAPGRRMQHKSRRGPSRRSGNTARRSQALQGAGRRQAVSRRLVRRREQRLRRRRLQPDLPHRRRRQELGAVVRPDRQSQVLQPLRDPPGGGRPLHRRRRRPGAEARSRPRSASTRLPCRTRAASSASSAARRRCWSTGCAATHFAATTAARPGKGRRRTAGDDRWRRRRRRRRRSCSPTSAAASARASDGGATFKPCRSRIRCRSPASPTRATAACALVGPRGVAVAEWRRADDQARRRRTGTDHGSRLRRSRQDAGRPQARGLRPEIGQSARAPGVQQPAGDGRRLRASSRSRSAISRRRSWC